ncbi:hypothetical protein GM658_03195 [Pseudoduganella eburnea]|uniref:Uncharacterized protein n=1 Tax=Massilia eburnea TaxID=1776165 RepID=A0A6L6QCZ2_9BURK|nr:hypothetical protein [Massilia eburnea]MTW09596.1 hypothetical protein [Massilia eburnea]
MKFTFEKISDEDKERIIADANKGNGPAVEFAKYGDTYFYEDPGWAVDRWRTSYLIRAPLCTTSGTSQRFYYLFSEGEWYKLERRTMFSNQFVIRGQEQVRPNLLSHLKEQLTAAFAAYGDMGDGKGDHFGATFLPVFVLESKRR